MQLEIHPDGLIATLSKPDSELKTFLSDAIIHSLKEKYHRYEIPRKYIFINEDFTHENGMLTQTMKIKRRSIIKKYYKDLDSLYP